MEDPQLISYFNNNITEIFRSKTSKEIDFIALCIEDERIQDLIKDWPEDIKIRIVKKYLIEEEGLNKGLEEVYSWSEYYEMYDGKFDERNMLYIKVKKENLTEISSLGYREIKKPDQLNLLTAGEYKLDLQQNIDIIHSCPDLEIFGGDIKQHLEELGIKSEWVIKTALSAI